MNIGIIDIGSNTINILIAKIEGKKWHKIAEYKNPAKLAKGGIDKNILTNEAMDRGVSALKNHLRMAEKHDCEKIVAYATAAVRDANNKEVFLKRVKEEAGLNINVIDGLMEAQLISHGIIASQALDGGCNLILDIGGGSTEFILINNSDIVYKQSYRLGVTKLLEKFQPNDPLSENDLAVISDHIKSSISNLEDEIRKHSPTRLVGASGSFDSLSEMNSALAKTPLDEIKNEIPLANYHILANKILVNNLQERSKIPGLVPHRVEPIPMAIILINEILKNQCIKEIYQSSYALKEGAVELILQQQLS